MWEIRLGEKSHYKGSRERRTTKTFQGKTQYGGSSSPGLRGNPRNQNPTGKAGEKDSVVKAPCNGQQQKECHPGEKEPIRYPCGPPVNDHNPTPSRVVITGALLSRTPVSRGGLIMHGYWSFLADSSRRMMSHNGTFAQIPPTQGFSLKAEWLPSPYQFPRNRGCRILVDYGE